MLLLLAALGLAARAGGLGSALYRGELGRGRLAGHDVLEALPGAEPRDLGRLHLDRRAAARVPGGAGLAVLPLEGPEADQRNAVALLDGDLGVLDQAAEHLVDVGTRHQRVLLDRVDEFLAVQG